jgi:transcriptional regulator with XRE-family HTH domain
VSKSVFTPAYSFLLNLLIARRGELGLTQLGLAEKLGRPQSFISKYERGERRLDLVELLDVAKALSLDPVVIVRKMQRQIERDTRV